MTDATGLNARGGPSATCYVRVRTSRGGNYQLVALAAYEWIARAHVKARYCVEQRRPTLGDTTRHVRASVRLLTLLLQLLLMDCLVGYDNTITVAHAGCG